MSPKSRTGHVCLAPSTPLPAWVSLLGLCLEVRAYIWLWMLGTECRNCFMYYYAYFVLLGVIANQWYQTTKLNVASISLLNISPVECAIGVSQSIGGCEIMTILWSFYSLNCGLHSHTLQPELWLALYGLIVNNFVMKSLSIMSIFPGHLSEETNGFTVVCNLAAALFIVNFSKYDLYTDVLSKVFLVMKIWWHKIHSIETLR